MEGQAYNLQPKCIEGIKRFNKPVPKLSSPQIEHIPASIKLPKNFHPVGTWKMQAYVLTLSVLIKNFDFCEIPTSKNLSFNFFATTSRAADVGILLKTRSAKLAVKTKDSWKKLLSMWNCVHHICDRYITEYCGQRAFFCCILIQ